MTWLAEVTTLTGEPGTLVALSVLAWRIWRLEQAHNAKVARLLQLEAQVHTHHQKLDNLTRWRERNHAP